MLKDNSTQSLEESGFESLTFPLLYDHHKTTYSASSYTYLHYIADILFMYVNIAISTHRSTDVFIQPPQLFVSSQTLKTSHYYSVRRENYHSDAFPQRNDPSVCCISKQTFCLTSPRVEFHVDVIQVQPSACAHTNTKHTLTHTHFGSVSISGVVGPSFS